MIGTWLRRTLILMLTLAVSVMLFNLEAAAGAWYDEAVSELARGGLFEGYPDGSFKPEQAVTKGEFVKMLMKGLGYNVEASSGSHWAMEYVSKAKIIGLLDVNTFEAAELDNPVTRNELAVFAVRAAILRGRLNGHVTYRDMPLIRDVVWIEAGDRTYVYLAYINGFMTGYPDGFFRGYRPATRAEAAITIARVFN